MFKKYFFLKIFFSFPPPEVKGDLSISWLYDEFAKQWSYWLPPEAIKTLRFGGYYMVKVKPGFSNY